MTPPVCTQNRRPSAPSDFQMPWAPPPPPLFLGARCPTMADAVRILPPGVAMDFRGAYTAGEAA